MKTEKLNYHLPQELIAQRPAHNRSSSRLLVFNRADSKLHDSRFEHIGDFLSAGDCLVLNDTKVLAARFFAQRKTGGKLEGLFLEQDNDGCWQVLLKGSGKVKTGEVILLKGRQRPSKDAYEAVIVEKKADGRCLLKINSDDTVNDVLETIGFAPLPPYIKRDDDPHQAAIDKKRYQTVFARCNGAVAAPTAGLHFTDELIEKLKGKGLHFAYVTLHTGAGTFKPVKTENVEDHEIHREWFSLNAENAELINRVSGSGGRIIAVGTTCVRTLETIASDGPVRAMEGWTQLFITSGFEFKLVDAMVTNFHLPRSTLLALVAAFAGLKETLDAYQYAIESEYRFYSYGDAMLIL